MKWILFIGLICGSFLATSAQEAMIPEDYAWKNRVILLFAAQADNNLLEQQYSALQADTEEISERDLLIFYVLPDKVSGNGMSQGVQSAKRLRNQYHIKNEEFCVILIGKDGSEKLRRNNLVEPHELYALIDGMPMRRQEMKTKKEH